MEKLLPFFPKDVESTAITTETSVTTTPVQ